MGCVKEHLRVAVDVMGSDYGPTEVLAGVCAFLASGSHPLEKLILVGDSAIIEAELERHHLERGSSIEIQHAPEAIAMDEKPLAALRHKKDASMFRAIECVQNGQADAVLSCGNTGSLMAGGTLKLRTIEGVLRPALASIIPTRHQPFILIDVGANPVADGHYLIQNAILGAHFAQAVLSESKPRVGLLTIGTEEGKGNASIQVAHDVLKQCAYEAWDYAGLMEGFDMFNNRVDVVVCDGFVGNILLKVCEALFGHLKDYLKEEFQKTWVRKTGACLCRGVFDAMKRQFSPEQFSGAPLLGLNGWVFKAHGSSKATAIEGALRICTQCLSVCDLQSVKADIAAVNALLLTESIAR